MEILYKSKQHRHFQKNQEFNQTATHLSIGEKSVLFYNRSMFDVTSVI